MVGYHTQPGLPRRARARAPLPRSSPRGATRHFPSAAAGSTASTWRAGSGPRPRRGSATGSRTTSSARSACGSGSRRRCPGCCKPRRTRSRSCGPSPARPTSRSTQRLAARMARQAILTREDARPADGVVPGRRGRAAPLHRNRRRSWPTSLTSLLTLAAPAERHDPGGAQRRARRADRGLRHRGEGRKDAAAYIETALTGQVFEDAKAVRELVYPVRCAQDRSVARHREPPPDRRGGKRMETAGNWRKSSYSGANGGECVEVASTPAP